MTATATTFANELIARLKEKANHYEANAEKSQKRAEGRHGVFTLSNTMEFHANRAVAQRLRFQAEHLTKITSELEPKFTPEAYAAEAAKRSVVDYVDSLRRFHETGGSDGHKFDTNVSAIVDKELLDVWRGYQSDEVKAAIRLLNIR